MRCVARAQNKEEDVLLLPQHTNIGKIGDETVWVRLHPVSRRYNSNPHRPYSTNLIVEFSQFVLKYVLGRRNRFLKIFRLNLIKLFLWHCCKQKYLSKVLILHFFPYYIHMYKISRLDSSKAVDKSKCFKLENLYTEYGDCIIH